MIRDYQVVSPSLDGILKHESIVYGGVKRSLEVAKILDRSTIRDVNRYNIGNRRIMEGYYHDLYGILVKELSQFAIESEPIVGESLKLQAMLQEFIKVKKYLMEYRESNSGKQASME